MFLMSNKLTFLYFCLFILISCNTDYHKTYHLNGEVKESVKLNSNGKFQGKYFEYDDKHYLKQKSNYENGILQGKSYYYFQGNILIERTYDNGKLNGEVKKYSNSLLVESSEYCRGMKLSDYVYYPNGYIKYMNSYFVGSKKINNAICFDSLGNIGPFADKYFDSKYLLLEGNKGDSLIVVFVPDFSEDDQIRVSIDDSILDGISIDVNNKFSLNLLNDCFSLDTVTVLVDHRRLISTNVWSSIRVCVQIIKGEEINEFNMNPIW